MTEVKHDLAVLATMCHTHAHARTHTDTSVAWSSYDVPHTCWSTMIRHYKLLKQQLF